MAQSYIEVDGGFHGDLSDEIPNQYRVSEVVPRPTFAEQYDNESRRMDFAREIYEKIDGKAGAEEEGMVETAISDVIAIRSAVRNELFSFVRNSLFRTEDNQALPIGTKVLFRPQISSDGSTNGWTFHVRRSPY